jgi:hypothetical protein
VESDRLKALHKGDPVTIKFHTDIERHRIETLTVVTQAPAAGGPASKPAPNQPDANKGPAA